MHLPLTLYGDPLLREKAHPIQTFDAALATLADDMVETMYAEEGVGLAAPQIGLGQRLFVIDMRVVPSEDYTFVLDGRSVPVELVMPMTFVNPVLLLDPEPVVQGEEGCLSIPGLRAEVSRPDRIEVRFQDVRGGEHTLQASGYMAKVIQHEFDHLNGVLFIDYVKGRARKQIERDLAALEAELAGSRATAPESSHP